VIKAPGATTERISRGQLRSESISVLGRRDPVTVPLGTSLGEALRTMQQNEGEPLVILDGGRVAGVLTERDVLTKVLGRDVDLSGPVDAAMRPDPETMSVDGTIGEALSRMEQGLYRTLPLVDGEGALVGLLRQQDILAFVAEAFPQEILNLPPDPDQHMERPEGG
jgi:CBS domain-containing protein